MIVRERITYNGAACYRIYSDANRYIVHGDETDICQVVVPADEVYQCTEGNLIPDETALVDKAEAYDILTGISE